VVVDTRYEQQLWEAGYKHIAGVDDTGLGSLAGNVYVSAVIFPADLDYATILPGLNDSKKISAKTRARLYPLIKQHALAWATGTASVEEIDIHNIYWARFIAARRALDALGVEPNYVLMDGNAKIPDIDVPQTAIIKGDAKSISIAAASIIAKVERDQYMMDLATQVHPDYDWASNKAYYGAKHVAALKKHGRTKWHRTRFLRKLTVGPEEI